MSFELENDGERREFLLKQFAADRYLAHKHIFAHRHKDETPDFHDDILRLFYSAAPDVALMAFRGAGKSTLLEEYVLLSVLFRDFRYPVIVGNSLERACERLNAIKTELINNDFILDLFGDQVSTPWNEDQIVLANGAKIQAFGARQSLRGAKHNDERPDAAIIDDLEDEESVATEESRRKTARWLNSALRPSLNPKTGKIRFIGTAIHPKALIVLKCEDKRWASRKFPVLYIDEDGVEQSAWDARFSIDFLKNIREGYLEDGNMIEFEQEYMCRAENVGDKLFQQSMVKVVPQPNVWLPKIGMVDPARTTGKRSARTGYAVWSWTGSKLIVHEAFGGFHKPDEIIDTMFKLDTQYKFMTLGIEKDGLEEFLMQPLRHAMKERHHSLPLLGTRAPRDRDKDTFIKGLQPFYTAGDVEHAKALMDLDLELTSFPTGRKDVLNALAFALRLRTGKPVYEDFSAQHVGKSMTPVRVAKKWLVLSSRPSMTTAVLVQFIDGLLRVFDSWVVEGPPMEEFENIFRDAIQVAGGEVKLLAPPEQFDKYLNNGLGAAAKRLRLEIQRGASTDKAMGCLGTWLKTTVKGEQAFKINETARWAVNALSGGYARRLLPIGKLEDFPEDNQYRVLMEGLESFVCWFDRTKKNDDTDDNKHYAYTPDGRRYLTSLAR